MHDHRPIWNFTYPHVAAETGLGTVIFHQLRYSGASVDTARQYRTLDAVQKRGVWSQVQSMHRNEHSSRIAADYGKLLSQVRTLWEECEKTSRQILLGSRHFVHVPLVEPVWPLVCGLVCRRKKSCSNCSAWDTIFDIPLEVRYRAWKRFCLTPPSGAISMRAKRVALSLFSFHAKSEIPTQLVQPRASFLWRATTSQAL